MYFLLLKVPSHRKKIGEDRIKYGSDEYSEHYNPSQPLHLLSKALVEGIEPTVIGHWLNGPPATHPVEF